MVLGDLKIRWQSIFTYFLWMQKESRGHTLPIWASHFAGADVLILRHFLCIGRSDWLCAFYLKRVKRGFSQKLI
jgi:hypothetical protein